MLFGKETIRNSIFIIVLTFAKVLLPQQTFAQDCVCTNTITASTSDPIVVASGQVWCVNSGSVSKSITMSGGTLCIAAGASFSTSGSVNLNSGNVINKGTFNFSWPSGTFGVNIENSGTINTGGFNDYSGKLNNKGDFYGNGQLQLISGGDLYNTGMFKMNSGGFQIAANATLHNLGKMYLRNLDFSGNYFYNSDSLEIETINALNSVFDNFGVTKVYTAASIGSSTYITNDSLLQFINVGSIEFNGPMLTNNGRLTVRHSASWGGNFKLNNNSNQCYNNGIITVSGQFQINAAGGKFVNNCRLVCGEFLNHPGNVENYGIIRSLGKIDNNGAANFYNATTGQVRGGDLKNSGRITGYGSFYFTGNTDNSGAFITGSSTGDPIRFYDIAPAGTIVDNNGGGSITNTIRPASMTAPDTGTYTCTAPASVAGYPPTVKDFIKSVCDGGTAISFNLSDSVTANATIFSGDPFVLQYSSVKLFEYGNAANPTNNTTNLSITGKGVFSVNTTTGKVTFTPASGFTGTAIAEYRISNKRSGDAIAYPSGRKKITISLSGGITAPTVSVSGS